MRNKKITIGLLLLLSILILTSCGSNIETKEDTKLKVVTTIFPAYDFVRNIGEDKLNNKLLIKPGSETHSYEPSPKDIIDIEKSDLFIYVGGESDAWVEKILSSMDKDQKNIIRLIDGIDLVKEEIVEGMTVSHEEDDDEYDEHVWTSIRNSEKIVENIYEKLAELDKENKEFYKENKDKYINELDMLDKELEKVVKNAKNDTVLFADRFPFRYLFEDYNLKYYAAFPGCAEQTEPNPSTIKYLIDKVKSEDIDSIFYIEFSSENLANMIIEDTNAKKYLLHSAHNVSKEDFDNNIGYIDIMKENIKNLEEALN